MSVFTCTLPMDGGKALVHTLTKQIDAEKLAENNFFSHFFYLCHCFCNSYRRYLCVLCQCLYASLSLTRFYFPRTFSGNGSNSIPQILYVYPNIYTTDEMDNDEIISCFGRFRVFFSGLPCAFTAHTARNTRYKTGCSLLFVYLPFSVLSLALSLCTVCFLK